MLDHIRIHYSASDFLTPLELFFDLPCGNLNLYGFVRPGHPELSALADARFDTGELTVETVLRSRHLDNAHV
jgi:hypothetical protein